MFKPFLRTIKFLFLTTTLTLSLATSTSRGRSPFKPYDAALNTDFTYFGRLRPSVYYTPRLHSHQNHCPPYLHIPLKNRRDQEIIKICSDVLTLCLSQGSCLLKIKTQWRLISYQTQKEGSARFDFVDNSRCVKGSAMECLKPFYSVAADPNFYPPGTIFYIPKLKGLKLPGGQQHEGFVKVADTGGDIVGPRRIDFYTGFWSSLSKNNVFHQMGLGDANNEYDFYVVHGDTRQKALNHLSTHL